MNDKNRQVVISTVQRDYGLDFVKGFLVEVMVIYHVINYCFSFRHPILIYIDFVTGSFVFITGYIVSSIYATKYNDDARKIASRLVIRGLKILSLFLFINFLVQCISLKNYNVNNFIISSIWKNLGIMIYNGSPVLSVFELLVPIAYTLILSSIIVSFLKKRSYTISAVIPFMFISMILKQDNYFNLYFTSIGLAGLVAGHFVQIIKKYSGILWAKLLSLIALITYYMIIVFHGRDNLILYLLGIISALFFVYSFAAKFCNNSKLYKSIVILGKYSLVCYLVQIFFLQLSYIIFGNKMTSYFSLPVFFIVTNLVLYLQCFLIHSLRHYSKGFNNIYVAIFG